MPRSLQAYRAKRDFSRTPEPPAAAIKAFKRSALPKPLRFVVQRHRARREHFDLRLELDGAMMSWAVTRGPSANPSTKRLAVRTEDHPISYNDFEGVIPEKQYGAGPVMIWDRGGWAPVEDDVHASLRDGHLKFTLTGERMRGRWALVRLKDEGKRENWLLVKDRDAFAETGDGLADRFKTSVVTGRTFPAIIRGDKAAPRAASHPPPKFIPPMLCATADKPPSGDGWQFEMKYDGYRLQLAVGDKTVALRTRTGIDWTDRFPDIANAAKLLKVRDTVLDGEAVAFDSNGIAAFPKLVTALSHGGAGIVFVAFDVLRDSGIDLTNEPLSKRRAKLTKLLSGKAGKSGAIRLAPVIESDGNKLLADIAAAGGEGIIAKRLSSRYLSQRSPSWLKIKTVAREDAVVVGYAPSPAGRKFASLLLALPDKGALRFVGGVGSGFSAKIEREAFERLSPLKRTTPPPGVQDIEAAPRGVTWVEPKLTAAIAFGGYSAERRLRAARFLGWRDDIKVPAMRTSAKQEPAQETASAARSKARAEPASPVVITHPARIVFPDVKLTKGDVAAYYQRVARLMLPHLLHRPISVVRAPDRLDKETFFQRHPMPAMKRGIERVRAPERARGDYFALDSAEGIATVVQFGGIEFHGWGAILPDLDSPDRMVFDLDPADDVPFSTVKRGAELIRNILDSAGLKSFPLVSGGKGVHVVVPLDATHSWTDIEDFTSRLARIVARVEPDRYVAIASKSRRKGKIYVDWLRNKRSATAIVPYSLRAKANASIATPVSWRALAKIDRADHFTVADPCAAARPLAGLFRRAPTDRCAGIERSSRVRLTRPNARARST